MPSSSEDRGKYQTSSLHQVSDEAFDESRSWLRATVSVMLAIIFIVLAVWYLARNPGELVRLTSASLPLLVAVAICFVANTGFYGYFTFIVLRSFGVKVTLVESIGLSYATSMYNQLLPMRLGIGLRAYYMKRVHGFSYSHFVGVMTAFFSLLLLAHASLGLLGVFVVAATGERSSLLVFGILIVVIIVSFWALFLSPSIGFGGGRVRTSVRRVVEGLHVIRMNQHIFAVAVLTTVCTVLCTLGVYYFAFSAMNLPLDIFESLLMMASQTIGGQLGFTPGGLGFKEAFGLYFASVLSITVAQTLMVLVTVRVITASMSVILGIPASMWLSRRLLY